MTAIKPGDRIRRIADPIDGIPLGFETVVVAPDPMSVMQDRVWYSLPGGWRNVHSLSCVWELVLDEPALPVRTRTITEIVTGQYGQVSVMRIMDNPDGHVAVALLKEGQHVTLDTGHYYMNATALRAAARVFVALAEALEEHP